MPGLEQGPLPLALLCLRVQHALPAPVEERADWGPYERWARPLVLLARNRPAEVDSSRARVPEVTVRS